MSDERDPFDTRPRLIDEGRVAQVIVEYTGLRLGKATYRGRVSGRDYFFDAGPFDKQHYVLLKDADHFRTLVDFRVLEESKIDPQEDRLQAIERELAQARARSSAPTDQRQGERARTGNRGGRPRIPLPEQKRLWHLRHHMVPRWPIDDLADEFLSGGYETPNATISTRLSRFKKKNPTLLSEDVCPFCTEGYYPSPPGSS